MSAAERRDAAIEAVARVLAGGDGPFDVLNGPEQFVLRDEAEKVIDAALPYLSGDEYHSLDELYLYRMLYNAHAANEWARYGTYPVVKSRFHSDGDPCFGGGWFIVVATLPTGQVSNHYRDEFWPLFRVPEVPLPPEYDGHTPEDAATRLRSALDAALPRLVGEPVGYGVVPRGVHPHVAATVAVDAAAPHPRPAGDEAGGASLAHVAAALRADMRTHQEAAAACDDPARAEVLARRGEGIRLALERVVDLAAAAQDGQEVAGGDRRDD